MGLPGNLLLLGQVSGSW